jgi:hypothetical protein
VILTPEVLAMAHYTAEQRPLHISKHNPPSDPIADLVGAMAEHAFAHIYGIRQDSITWDGGTDGWGDGGVDFTMLEGTVDLKASHKWPDSWVVKKGPCRSDWYVFGTVYLPDTVVFKAKARKEVIEPIELSQKVGNNRIVRLEWLEDFHVKDFTAL